MTEEAANGNGLHDQVVDVLKTCYDPEIPVDIYELGLIYKIDVEDGGKVAVDMTLTSPACPVAGTLPPEVEAKISRLDGVSNVRVDLVWDPPWNPDRMSEAGQAQARLPLGREGERRPVLAGLQTGSAARRAAKRVELMPSRAS